jgi:hypothetical protein
MGLEQHIKIPQAAQLLNKHYTSPILPGAGGSTVAGRRHICMRKLQIYHCGHGNHSTISGSLCLLKISQFQQVAHLDLMYVLVVLT